MCGIACTINGSVSDTLRLLESIKRRGNTTSYYEYNNIKVCFTHLSIVDQNSPNQPYESDRYVIWLNGYISNHKELRLIHDLKCETDVDTEVLLKFIDKYGYSKLSDLNGFFAVLCYDKHLKELRAFTDRYGIKQLYRYTDGKKTFICSELKGLIQNCSLELDLDSVDQYRSDLGVMNLNTIFKGVSRVKSLQFNKPSKIEIDYDKACDKLLSLWKQSIYRNKTELKSGVFLSGGIDSGMIAKWVQPDYSFSMDYLTDLSEIENIKENTNGVHFTMICNDMLKDEYIRKTLEALDDFKVGSCYTNFALTELASKYCTVLYSGAGGDEVFNGYTHRYSKPIEQVIKRTKYDYTHEEISHKDYDWLYLRGILVVEDRMAGWHTMETRYPFLDNDFVNFALSLPDEYLNEKRILKDISGLPDKVLSGKKKGFSNPHFTNTEWVDYCLSYGHL